MAIWVMRKYWWTRRTCTSECQRQNQAYKPFGPKSKNDSVCGQHRIVWIARDGTQNAVQSMRIIMEYRYRLLHVRKLLAQRNSGQSKVRSIYDGSFFSPWVCHQKGKLHRHRYGKKSGNKKYYLASQLMKKCKKKTIPKKAWWIPTKSKIPYSTDWTSSRWRSLSRWDAHADENDTHHQAQQKYFYTRTMDRSQLTAVYCNGWGV